VALATKTSDGVEMSCVDSIDTAAAVLGSTPAVVEEVKRRTVVPEEKRPVSRSVHVPVRSSRRRSITGGIVINILDAPGVGFNDATVVAPVGGNTGTTLGTQRLNVFAHAASIWASTLDSPVSVAASWDSLPCTASTAALASAGTISVFRDFGGLEKANTWYGGALANRQNGTDLDPTQSEMRVRANVNLGQPGCLFDGHLRLSRLGQQSRN
jgi:hypothetical protein